MSDLAKLKKKAADLEQRRQFDRALAVYEEMLLKQEGSDDADVSLLNRVGDLRLRLGRSDEALDAYERAVELYVERGFLNNAIALCNKILRQDPGRADVHYRLGRISAEKGFRSDAKRHFLEYAGLMQATGRLDEAFAALLEFAELSPEHADIRLVLAEQLVKHDRTAEAIGQLTILLEGYEAERRHAEAEGIAERIRALDPTFAAPPHSGMDGMQDTDLQGADPFGSRPATSTRGQGGMPELVLIEPTEFGGDAPARARRPSVEMPETLIRGDALDDALDHVQDDRVDMGADIVIDVRPDVPGVSEVQVGLLEGLTAHGETMDALAGDAPSALDGFEATELDPAGPEETVPAAAEHPSGTVEVMEFEPTIFEPADIAPVSFADTVLEPIQLDVPELDVSELEVSELEVPELEVSELEVSELEVPAVGSGESASGEPVASEEDARSADFDLILSGPPEGTEEGSSTEPEPRDELLAFSIELDAGLESPAAFAPAVDDDELRLVEALPDLDVGFIDAAGADVAEMGFLEVAHEAVVAPEAAAPEAAAPEFLLEVPHLDDPAEPGEGEGSIPELVSWHDAPQAIEVAAASTLRDPSPQAAEDSDFVNLGDLLRSEDGPRSTRMVVEEKAPTGDEQADFAEMLRKFKEGVAENVDEGDYESHHDLGVAYKEMGLLDEAVAAFQRALRGTPHRARTYEALGHCFLERRQYAVASAVLQRALAEPGADDQQLVGVLYLLGRSAEALNQRNEALSYYQRVFAVDIEFADVARRMDMADRVPR